MAQAERKQAVGRGVDLAAARATLDYLHAELSRFPGLERARDAIAMAQMEIATQQRRSRTIVPLGVMRSRLMPRRSN
ncbi:MAG: hypothetical protein AB7K67_06825 [Hyphomicrobiaceae bacterium]|jgi:hypothetical protein